MRKRPKILSHPMTSRPKSYFHQNICLYTFFLTPESNRTPYLKFYESALYPSLLND